MRGLTRNSNSNRGVVRVVSCVVLFVLYVCVCDLRFSSYRRLWCVVSFVLCVCVCDLLIFERKCTGDFEPETRLVGSLQVNP